MNNRFNLDLIFLFARHSNIILKNIQPFQNTNNHKLYIGARKMMKRRKFQA